MKHTPFKADCAESSNSTGLLEAPPAIAYEIANWEGHYEKSQGRRVKNHTWVAVPNKHDGGGFRRITVQENSTDLFAAWVLIVQVASKCPARGLLVSAEGMAIDAEEMAVKTGFPVRIFSSAFSFFCSERMGWLVRVNLKTLGEYERKNGEHAERPQKKRAEAPSAETHRTGHNKTEKTQDMILAPTVPEPHAAGGVPLDHGKNNFIHHRPEDALKIPLEDYGSFCKFDVTAIACTICDEFSGGGMGAFSRWLKKLAQKVGDKKACHTARELLFAFWRELQAGEEPDSRCAALLARCRKNFDDRT
jgi:hypothetical protein